MINGLPARDKDGNETKTPIDIEVEVGETVVRIEAPGFQPFEQTLTIEGGKTQTVSRELAVAGKSEAELVAEQRGLSSFGARTLPRGRSTVDFDVGYPYFLTARITVGAGKIAKKFGFDANVGVRTMLARSELGLGGRDDARGQRAVLGRRVHASCGGAASCSTTRRATASRGTSAWRRR